MSGIINISPCLFCLQHSCLVNLESACPLDTSYSPTAESSLGALGLLHGISQPLPLAEHCQSAYGTPASNSACQSCHWGGRSQHVAMPCLLCLAAFAYLAELTALHFDSHLRIEEAKTCTRSVSVISASRAAEADGNCQAPLNVCSMNTRQPCTKVNLHHWLYKSLTCMNVFYSKMDNNWLFTVS